MGRYLCISCVIALSTVTIWCMEDNRKETSEEEYQRVAEQYGQKFFDYFFAESTAEYYLNPDRTYDLEPWAINSDHLGEPFIKSLPNIKSQIPDNTKMICAITVRGQDGGRCLQARSFDDGSVKVCYKSGNKIVVFRNYNLPNLRVVALARGRGIFGDDQCPEPYMLAGCSNGNVLFFSGNGNEVAAYSNNKYILTPIDYIISGPLPFSWMITSGNTVALYQSTESFFAKSKNNMVSRFNCDLSVPSKKIVGLGIFHNSILVKLQDQDENSVTSSNDASNSCYLFVPPYPADNFEVMYHCRFSLLQAWCLNAIIDAQEQKNREQEEQVKQSGDFQLLPDTVRDIIQLKSRVVFGD